MKVDKSNPGLALTRRHRRGQLLALCLLAVLFSACVRGTQGVLTGVQVGMTPISPDLRLSQNHFDITYTLRSPATMSAYVEGPGGQRWTLYENQLRPRSGNYDLSFDGTVAGPDPNEKRVLPDGTYRVILEANADGLQQESTANFDIRNADTNPPMIQNLTLNPDWISPNGDAVDDAIQAVYTLTKASKVSAFLDAVQPDGTNKRVWEGNEVSLEAGDRHFEWQGKANSRSVPNGSYLFGLRARDAAGNVSESSRPLTVADSGTPDARILQARIGPTQIVRGGQVCADITVRNTGQTVLRTEGPDPGYVYNSFDSFSSIENHAYSEKAGFWRVGMDYSNSPDPTGAKYPFRWGFGHDLSPGEDVTVHGCVQVFQEQTRIVFFAGLVQENVSLRDKGAGTTSVDVSS